MRMALAGLVRSFGFAARTFESAEDFLANGIDDVCCCIITDIQMPGLSGIELKHRLDVRENPPPVILITARSEPHVHAQARASGAVCLLRKPFDADTLLACLKKAQVA